MEALERERYVSNSYMDNLSHKMDRAGWMVQSSLGLPLSMKREVSRRGIFFEDFSRLHLRAMSLNFQSYRFANL